MSNTTTTGSPTSERYRIDNDDNDHNDEDPFTFTSNGTVLQN